MPDGGADRRLRRSWLEAEWRAALAGLEIEDARLLARHGLHLPLLAGLGLESYTLMVGAIEMRVEGHCWVPDPTGHRGFVTPVRTRGDAYDVLADEIVITGPLIDLVAWHPQSPGQWATRAGVAEWLGAWDPGIAAEREEPVRIWRDPFRWLLGWMAGIVPLTDDHAELHRLLVDMPAIRAEDAMHARQLQFALERPPYAIPPVAWRKAA
jgi:hypothetical protein